MSRPDLRRATAAHRSGPRGPEGRPARPGSRWRAAAAAAAAGAVLAWGAGPAGAEDLFSVQRLATSGRTVAAGLADLDGDGRSDLYRLEIEGLPPDERRTLRVHRQGAAGLPPQPDFALELPPGAAAYDVADVAEWPGEELILLRHRDVLLLSLASPEAPRRSLPLPDAGSLGTGADERGLERFRLVRRDTGGGKVLWLPVAGGWLAMAPDGSPRARLEAPGRTNYYAPQRPGLVLQESDIQAFVDPARLVLGDVDGDGLEDAVTATRHELRVFLRREEGGLPTRPDARLGLGLVTAEDHVRGSGGVETQLADLDGDGLLDLLVTWTRGSLADAVVRTRIHLNRGGTWNLSQPDQVLEAESTWLSDALLDADGDGRPELLRARVPISVFELVEALLTREVDVGFDLRRPGDEKPFAERPTASRAFSLGFSLETFRPAGFAPTPFHDWNGDGLPDLVTSGDGDAFVVYAGDARRPWQERAGRQALAASGVLQPGDLDGDDLLDFVLFDPQRPGHPVRVGRNRGALPGTPPRLRPAEDDG